MPDSALPAVARYRLRVALREAREAKHLTQAWVAKELEWSLSKVNRIEAGEVTVSRTDLMALLQLYDIADHARVRELTTAARASRQRGWWDKPEYRANLTSAMAALIQVEAVAEEVLLYEPIVMPGLLQTPQYAEAVLDAWREHLTEQQRQTRREIRLQRRQRLLDREPPANLQLLLDESVLLREVGGKEVMAELLSDLLTTAQRPSVSLRILPLAPRPAIPVVSAFQVWLFDDNDAVLYHENRLEDEIAYMADKPNLLESHRQLFDNMWRLAMPEQASLRTIEAHTAELRADLARTT